MRKRQILICVCFFVFSLSLLCSRGAFSQDGVLQSGQKAPQRSSQMRSQLNQRMSQYVQQAVTNTVLQETSTVFSRILKRQSISILPQVAYQAVEQTALQLFKQEASSKSFRDAFTHAYDKTMETLDKGESLSNIQSQVQASIKKDVAPVFEGRLFQRIVEEILKRAIQQHQKIIAMTLMQRQAQAAMIQKQRQVLQQAMVQQVRQAFLAYQQQIMQEMAQKYQKAMADQANEQYQSSLQQQYEQQLQALQQEMKSQYDRAVLQALSGQ